MKKRDHRFMGLFLEKAPVAGAGKEVDVTAAKSGDYSESESLEVVNQLRREANHVRWSLFFACVGLAMWTAFTSAATTPWIGCLWFLLDVCVAAPHQRKLRSDAAALLCAIQIERNTRRA